MKAASSVREDRKTTTKVYLSFEYANIATQKERGEKPIPLSVCVVNTAEAAADLFENDRGINTVVVSGIPTGLACPVEEMLRGAGYHTKKSIQVFRQEATIEVTL